MARHNYVSLHGQLVTEPRIYINEVGQPQKASLAIRVIRRPFIVPGEGAVSTGKLSLDTPIVMTMNPELINKCSELRNGDMVDICGVYTTREVKKTTICPQGHKVEWDGNFVFITPIYICRRETGLSQDEGIALLRTRTEISNRVMIIGTLCRDPVLRETTDGSKTTAVAQYQLAANRRYHIRDGHEERTDYPWIKTINRQARDDAEHLRMGSSVFIDGAIQTREIERSLTCPECGTTFSYKEPVCEIFPYSVEYLTNCIFPPKEDSSEDTVDSDAPEEPEATAASVLNIAADSDTN